MSFLRLFLGEHFQKQWPVTADHLTIGRASDNDIVLRNPSVSKYHAAVEKDGSAFVLVDKESANGVFVNGERVTRHVLSYWDEIQIYPFKLVYMAVAKLPGEEEGLDPRVAEGTHKDATMVVKLSDIDRAMHQKQKPDVVYLVREGATERYVLDKLHFTLGRARSSDLRCGGWFAPGLAATIQRRRDGFYLVPTKRARVLVNDLAVQDAVRLANNDRLEVQGIALMYCVRPLG